MSAQTILIGEDDPLQRKMIRLMLTKALDYSVLEAGSGKEVLEQIERHNLTDIQAVLLDLNMPGMDGFEVLKRIRMTRPDLPVLMLTAQNDTPTAVKAIKAGASDFIVKPPVPEQVHVALQNAIRMSQLTRELHRLKRDKEGALCFSDIIGHAHGLVEAVGYGRKAATSDVAILLTGETSTGKELLARAIHGESRRMGGPFVTINCSAIPSQAIESVLFGYEKGALPGAATRTIGKFREAERGTIFLDDIHLLSADAQVKLLRVLQEKEVEPIGAGKPVKVNIRIISATNCDLREEVRAGRFREDLYFRLNVLTIAMPALRERRGDVLPLVEYFIERLAAADALPMKTLSADARQYLEGYSWPGNIRELEGLIHRALVLADGDTIDRALLMQIHDLDTTAPVTMPPHFGFSLHHPNGVLKTMDEIESDAMQAVLEHCDHNVTRAAETLAIAKSTFYRKIKPSIAE